MYSVIFFSSWFSVASSGFVSAFADVVLGGATQGHGRAPEPQPLAGRLDLDPAAVVGARHPLEPALLLHALEAAGDAGVGDAHLLGQLAGRGAAGGVSDHQGVQGLVLEVLQPRPSRPPPCSWP